MSTEAFKEAQARYNKAVAAWNELANAPSPAWVPYEPEKQPFSWGFTIGLTVMGALILGWALLISLGNMESRGRLEARGCEEVWNPQDPRLVGKTVDMTKEVWVCADGGIVYR